MPETANVKNPEMFEPYKLYFRTRYRGSDNYNEFVERIGREPNIIYPDGWFDTDVDRVIVGGGCIHFGMQEFKYVDSLSEPSCRDDSRKFASREYVRNKLDSSDMQIEFLTTNYTILGSNGVLSNGLNVAPISCSYGDFLKDLKRVKRGNGELGKGVFLFIFYTENLEYFSPINFTGSKYVFGKNVTWIGNRAKLIDEEYVAGIPKNKLKLYLRRVGNIIEPCFSEFLLFLVEAYVRQDFGALYKYFSVGKEEDLIRFSKRWEKSLARGFTRDFPEDYQVAEDRVRTKMLSKWDAFCHAMEWILDCIHFDTILENPEKYIEFVELVRNGEINNVIRDIISNRYKHNMKTLRSSR